MPGSTLPERLLARVSLWIADRMGLNFLPSRWPDLERGLAGAAAELALPDAEACAQWLLSSVPDKEQIEVLAGHLTVGETYFFREQKTLDALVERVIPELMESRKAQGRRLRIWSAACCTGEEPYSLAILLDRLAPGLKGWHISILATDINGRFLKKAATGIYGEWSFRDAPAWLKDGYFRKLPGGRYSILPELKKRVTFAHLNLAEDNFPALETDTNAMDLILCRNVLMYFTLHKARKVVNHLRRALCEDGWLVVSATEYSQELFSGFSAVNFPGATLYRKTAGKGYPPPWKPALPSVEFLPLEPVLPMPLEPAPMPVEPAPEGPVVEAAKPDPQAVAASLYEEGRYSEAADVLLASFNTPTTAPPQAFPMLTRALANQGKLTEALAWCDRWLAVDKLDTTGHYLRAIVLQELGDTEQARHSLQRTVYLNPDFVLAHFALGNLARERDHHEEADKHYANALRLLGRCAPDAALPESEGLTAARLTEIIQSLFSLETTP